MLKSTPDHNLSLTCTHVLDNKLKGRNQRTSGSARAHNVKAGQINKKARDHQDIYKQLKPF